MFESFLRNDSILILRYCQNCLTNIFSGSFGHSDRHFPSVSNFGLKFAPDLIHGVVRRLGAFLDLGSTMGTAYPTHNKFDPRDESRLRGDEDAEGNRLREDDPTLRDDEHADDLLSLLEENARLRGLVVKLSNLILRSVADQR